MSNPPSAVARPGPVIHGSFPLTWEVCSDRPNEHAQHVVNEANENTLRNILLLDNRVHDTGDERDEATPEIQRLEQRLNLVIDLLAQVLSRDLHLPVPVPCEISRDVLLWSGDALPAPGAGVRASVYLNPNYPRPLCLYGVVETLEPREQGLYVRVRVSALPEPVGEYLDRLIFRDHRRRIAQTRRSK